MDICAYLKSVQALLQSGYSTEHTFRGELVLLLQNAHVTVINEPKRQACGAPDYLIQQTSTGLAIGYIEAKDVGLNLADVAQGEQMARYRKALSNLILTDYLEFWFYQEGVLLKTLRLGRFDDGKMIADAASFAEFEQAINHFMGYTGINLSDAEQLARLMADKALLMREVFAHILANERENSAGSQSLIHQLEGFKEVLLHNLSDGEFVAMYAQTITYGFFVARLQTTQESFTLESASRAISKRNPFLRRLFGYITGEDLDDRALWILSDLVQLLQQTVIEELFTEWRKQETDPFLHFYETFLHYYDGKTKKDKGVYYTPAPVVNFMVDAVDELLKAEFGLKNGLADHSLLPPVQDKPPQHRVQILDPATGTGTFLAAIMQKIHGYFTHNPGVWNDYVDAHLIPRLHGFEVMMTPYVMCHLKLEYTLAETGYQNISDAKRFEVYLTNALDNMSDSLINNHFLPWLAQEANNAHIIKNDKPIMVVMGNPPYNVNSVNGELFKAELEVYKQEPRRAGDPARRLQERNSKMLNDDYVRFIRLAEKMIAKQKTGIIALITNHGFLDNGTFRGMRYHLLRSFDALWVLDLSTKDETVKKERHDENVFSTIKQGVCITFFVKNGKTHADELASVRYAALLGKRAHKFAQLTETPFAQMPWQTVQPTAPYFFLTNKVQSTLAGFSLSELFSINSAGIGTSRDKFAIHFTQAELKTTVEGFLRQTPEQVQAQWGYTPELVGKIKTDLSAHQPLASLHKVINYRPFDERHTFYTGQSGGFCDRPRHEVMQHMIGGNNVALLVCKIVKASPTFKHAFLANTLIDRNLISNKTSETTTCFPLWRTVTDHGGPLDPPTHNFNPDTFASIMAKMGVATCDPLELFDYIYAVLSSPKFRETTRDKAKVDFPLIPYPATFAYFKALAELGSQLRQLHLLTHQALAAMDLFDVRFNGSGDDTITKPTFKEGKVFINATQYFNEVPAAVWAFEIGSYAPAQQWLKVRDGRVLTLDDKVHYTKLLHSLAQTMQVQTAIDGLLELG